MAKRRRKASAADALQELDALTQAGDWEAAREPALALFKHYPTTPGVIERSIHVLRQLQQWQRLIDLLLEARNRYQLWPDGSDLLIGQSLVELEQWDQAIPYLQLALDQPEDAPWAHHFFGKALRHLNRIDEALTHQQKAVALLPDFPWAPFEVAQLLMEMQKPRLAVLELQEARRRHGSPNPVIEEQWQKAQPLVLLNRVDQLQVEGKVTEAFALLRQAMLLTPDDEVLSVKLIELLISQSKSPETSSVENRIEVSLLEQELNQIEVLLDQLESQVSGELMQDSSSLSDMEISYV